ncbi:hypothetical protein BGX16_1329 [Hallerella succinigenes]|uniref:Uncharacterized protein n=1 Tax=Hallerella succinigenes TaxID=1896222 RepID=A0A2M9A6M0_9BACT|nr:hypothetical protein BGX16_1329 [Hallerella succinigenes]
MGLLDGNAITSLNSWACQPSAVGVLQATLRSVLRTFAESAKPFACLTLF